MELWDAYNCNFEKIEGLTLIRGEEDKIPDGVYHLVCHVLVRHTDGTYLLMQRDPCKSYPNMWEATAGGSVLKDETALEGAFRELREETGIKAEKLEELDRTAAAETHSAHIRFLCITGCDKNSVQLQEGETCNFKWATADEILSLPRSEFASWPMRKHIERYKLPQRLERSIIYESDYVCLYADKVKLSNGYIIEKYHQIHYPHESVSIVIFNEKDEILMIQEKRYTVGRLEWEIPAGRIEEGETKEQAARREAMEETGCSLKDLKFLCTHNPANGMSDCTCHVFAAKVDSESSIQDINEVAGKKWMSIPAVKNLLKNNLTKDGVGILAILFALEFYERHDETTCTRRTAEKETQ